MRQDIIKMLELLFGKSREKQEGNKHRSALPSWPRACERRRAAGFHHSRSDRRCLCSKPTPKQKQHDIQWTIVQSHSASSVPHTPATYATQCADVALGATAVIELSEARAVPHQVGVAGTTWPGQRGLALSVLLAEEEEEGRPRDGHNKLLLGLARGYVHCTCVHVCMQRFGPLLWQFSLLKVVGAMLRALTHFRKETNLKHMGLGEYGEVPVCLQAIPQAVVVVADH